jgi:hypothetical protein
MFINVKDCVCTCLVQFSSNVTTTTQKVFLLRLNVTVLMIQVIQQWLTLTGSVQQWLTLTGSVQQWLTLTGSVSGSVFIVKEIWCAFDKEKNMIRVQRGKHSNWLTWLCCVGPPVHTDRQTRPDRSGFFGSLSVVAVVECEQARLK